MENFEGRIENSDLEGDIDRNRNMEAERPVDGIEQPFGSERTRDAGGVDFSDSERPSGELPKEPVSFKESSAASEKVEKNVEAEKETGTEKQEKAVETEKKKAETEKQEKAVETEKEAETEKQEKAVETEKEAGTEKQEKAVETEKEAETEKQEKAVETEKEAETEKQEKAVETEREAETEKQEKAVEDEKEADTTEKRDGLTDEQKKEVKERTGWPDEVIDSIGSMKEAELYERTGCKAAKIDGKWCLIREDIDMDQKDEDGITNRERMQRGRPPLTKDGQEIELHHIGQKPDSPLAELTTHEHRGVGNDTILHDKNKESEIDRNEFSKERKHHWKSRAEEGGA